MAIRTIFLYFQLGLSNEIFRSKYNMVQYK